MQMKVKAIFILVIITITPLFSGCKGENEAESFDVIVSIAPFADFVKAVAGDSLKAGIVIPPGKSPHNYEPTPSDIGQLSEADIYFLVGGPFQLEKTWTAKIKPNDSSKMKLVDCSGNIKIIENNPHYWLSPANARKVVNLMYEELSAMYPGMRSYFEQNKNSYLSKLKNADSTVSSRLSNLNTRSFMVYHPAWKYFARYYNLKEIGIEIEGKSPRAKKLGELVNFARENDVRAVFVEPQFSHKSAETIAKEIGASVVEINPLPENYIKNLIDVANKLHEYLR